MPNILPRQSVRVMFWFGISWIFFVLSTLVFAATVTDTSCSGGQWDSATLTNAECSSNAIQLNATGLSSGYGTTTSRIINGGVGASWSALGWSPEQPYTKELPSSTQSETGYTTGTIDMTGNVLLMYMNESGWNGTADEVDDASGSGNHGYANGNATTVAAGKFDRGGTFDGNGDWIRVEDVDSLEPENVTVMAWIYPTSDPSNYSTIFSTAEVGAYNGYALMADNGAGNMRFWVHGTGVNASAAISNNNLTLNAWNHLAGTYDGTNAKLYFNGKLVATVNDPGTIGKNADPNSVGRLYGDWNNFYFQGKIDELAVFSRALTREEIAAAYKRGGLGVTFQVRSCDDAACSGETFIGPDGTGNSYYSELTTSTVAVPNKTLIDIPDNQYFQYQAVLESSSSTASPILEDVTITYAAGSSSYNVPEFADMMYFTTMILGLWYAARRVIPPQLPPAAV